MTDSVQDDPPAAPARRRWRLRLPHLTVRSAILLAVLGLTALALFTAGYTASALQDARVDARIDADLSASAEEFRVLATVGVDPRTGEPFASPEELVRTAMERVIPARNEGVLGIVGGEVAYTTRGADIALEDDPELVDKLGPLVIGDTATYTTITTDIARYRLAAVPVRTTADGALAEEPDDAVPAHDSVAALVLGYDVDAEHAAFNEVFVTYALVAASSLAVVTAVGWAIAGRLLAPVRVLASTATRIGRGDVSERIPVTGTDDMAQMTASVNEMLDRIEAAFDSQRQLVGDVRHELRTPLTIVRGHLELMDPDDPDDAREVRALALDEVDRMNRVVGDLTTLATIDRPDFVTLGEVGIGPLTDDILDKVVMLGDRDWSVEARGDATVRGDRERLTQAWLQLAANAVKFSPAGSAICLGSASTPEGAKLWVRDEGVGIAAEDQERIFERFVRAGDGSTDGSGLGLAIVKAIAEGHGGTVQCVSAPGEGSTFTIVLPPSPEPEVTA
ncbi:sensor histidine kinase [Demequina muriae]|uniref:histidine kinase n=1 Tax=Demequina muriae TaxID=3051664 RepID=A0ABT8GJL9_9MICO|nr:HAMP domain-containing sensor histidine kinase [Demequina sp. EGI L300058]MDN4481619.1 HAMP domain-containing sensor histidine kinase [Demequina sp. EGI L300058]